jgi:creatinine amidohydrolase
MILQDMSWNQVRDIKNKEEVLVVVPTGAFEQHSYHLPLFTDSLIAGDLGAHFEKAHPEEVVLTPVIWLGYSPHHLAFPGTISVSHGTFQAMVKAVCDSLITAKFENFLILNAHAGNSASVEVVVQDLTVAHPDCRIFGASYWHLLKNRLDAIEQLRESQIGGMGHACEFETSVLMFTHPELIQNDRIEKDMPKIKSRFLKLDMFGSGTVSYMPSFDTLTEHGGSGDPTKAKRDKGERFVGLIIECLDELFDEMKAIIASNRFHRDVGVSRSPSDGHGV